MSDTLTDEEKHNVDLEHLRTKSTIELTYLKELVEEVMDSRNDEGEIKLKPHQERVIEEHKELFEKTSKLIDFMHTDTYAKLDPIDQGLLMVQLVAMNNYSDALERRIEIFYNEEL